MIEPGELFGPPDPAAHDFALRVLRVLEASDDHGLYAGQVARHLGTLDDMLMPVIKALFDLYGMGMVLRLWDEDPSFNRWAAAPLTPRQ